MSVICKMSVVNVRAYGENNLVELGVVCAEELMPSCGDGSAKANENYTFHQASPSGDAKVTLRKDVAFRTGEELYLIYVRAAEGPEFPGSIARVDARCQSVTDYGGVSKKVEVSGAYRYHDPRNGPEPEKYGVVAFNSYVSIDNPLASVQFEPGKEDYWIGIYRASELSMSQALAMAASS